MSLTKLFRQLRSRWWLIPTFAVAGLLIALMVTERSNRDVVDLFEARAVVKFEVDDSERDRDAATAQLADSADLAKEANRDTLEQGRGSVTADERTSELIFTSRSNSEDTSREVASQMRTAFLEAMVAGEGIDVEERRRAIIEEAAEIIALLDEIAPTEEPVSELEPLDPAQQATLDALNAEVAGLTQQRSKLAVDLVLAETGEDRAGTPEEIQQEIDLISTRLEDLYVQIAEITEATGQTSDRTVSTLPSEGVAPPRDGAGIPDVEDPEELEAAWMTAALEARYEELENEFEGLYVTGSDSSIQELAAVTVTDLTPERASLVTNSVLGLAGGILLALGLSLVDARLRRRVWVPADLPTRFFGEMPAAVAMTRGPLRRRVSVLKRRRLAVQDLRNLVVGVLERSPDVPVIGFSGVEVDHEEVTELSTLMATNLAVADRSVLFIDLDFTVPPDPQPSGTPSVVDLVESVRADPEGGAAYMKNALAELPALRPNLRTITTGHPAENPIDLVLTSAFGSLMQAARATADVVVTVMPPLGDHLAKALRQRVNHVVAVCAAGTSQKRTIASFDSARVPGSAELAGAVLVTGWRSANPDSRHRARKRWRGWLAKRSSTSLGGGGVRDDDGGSHGAEV